MACQGVKGLFKVFGTSYEFGISGNSQSMCFGYFFPRVWWCSRSKTRGGFVKWMNISPGIWALKSRSDGFPVSGSILIELIQ